MAYGQQGQQKSNGFVRGNAAPAAKTSAPATQDGETKERLSIFKVFKNKNGNGYSTLLKEAVTIPAGTRVAVFADVLKGKDGTEYEVLNIKKMKDRPAQ